MKRKSIFRIAVIQFYFYPDISAVSQMLFDLLGELSKKNNYYFTVFCSNNLSNNSTKNMKWIDLNNNLKIHRIRTFRFGKKSILSRLLDYSFFYIYIFFYFLFTWKWDCIISLTSPPLIA